VEKTTVDLGGKNHQW